MAAAKSSKKKTTTKKKPTKRKKKKSGSKRFWLILFNLFLIGLIFFSIFFFTVYLGFLGNVPTRSQLHDIKNAQATEVLSADGKLLGRYYLENRSDVSYDEISPNVIHALVATEDSRFYEHRGIDEIALLRVLFKSVLLRNSSAGGGSTLSQQLAKNLFPREDLWVFSMPVNKLREAIIAYRLERIYSKDEILTLYLNTVPFGENIFGIELAAERFFNKKPKNLTVDESAVLIGMLKANNSYNPRLHPERSLERRNVVIGQMVKYEYLSEEEGGTFKAKPLGLDYRVVSYNEGPAPYFLEMLEPELQEWCNEHTKPNGDPYNLYTDGLVVETTLNYDFQTYAQQSVKEYMANLQKVFDSHWSGREPWENNSSILQRAIRQSDRYRKMSANGKTEDEITAAFNQKVETSLFTWNGVKQVETTPLDSLKHYLKMLNAGFIAVEPQSGELKAWVGGINFRYFQYDHVNAARQSGSTFKPFVYLSALENGLSPYDYYSNEKKVYKDYQNWSPRNSHDDYEGYYSMEGALAESINTVAVDVLMQTGVDQVIETAENLGINSDLAEYPSLALGVSSISLKEMVTAYSTILNEGKYLEPNYLISIKDSQGSLLADFKTPTMRNTGLNEENCRILVHMLESVIDEGTGKAIRSTYGISGDFAGKTGTTQDQSDGWFIGMSPDLVAGCWVGADDPGIHFRTITYGQGAYMALPIVGKFFHKIYRDSRYSDMRYSTFKQPSSGVLAKLEIPSHINKLTEKPEEQGFWESIFGGKDPTTVDEQKPVEEDEEQKPKIWETIKNIFKKKK